MNDASETWFGCEASSLVIVLCVGIFNTDIVDKVRERDSKKIHYLNDFKLSIYNQK